MQVTKNAKKRTPAKLTKTPLFTVFVDSSDCDILQLRPIIKTLIQAPVQFA